MLLLDLFLPSLILLLLWFGLGMLFRLALLFRLRLFLVLLILSCVGLNTGSKN
jgi:hypothetical protein